ncbi:MAG: hypothetical protein EXR97_04005 [Nitrospiraceae bacterium]|nr:hypothetical protein [Nitrospiraceae bacterium]MSR24996.1 hypothetical protein [Nitrospiraceae bacterium]
MYHRRLAKSKAAEEFIHRKDFEPHWDRYAESRRIYIELEHFHLSALQLLDGFDELSSQDREFLVRDLDLPDNLQPDFKLARDLFSAGLDGVGLLIAGRGLEGVLRAAAKKRSVQFLRRDNRPPSPACEADFADLIDIFAKMRWRRDKSPVINKETAAFLHFLRTTRNSAAHPDLAGDHKHIKTAREQAKIAAQLAQDIWKRVTRPRTQFVTKSIQKD